MTGHNVARDARDTRSVNPIACLTLLHGFSLCSNSTSASNLALQIDAPLNNGVWGGPAYDVAGRVVGMAFQKSSTQTWMER